MARVPIINELLAVGEQTAEGSEKTPVTADVIQNTTVAVNRNVENIERKDKGLGRSRFGLVRGGNQEDDFEFTQDLILPIGATPVGTPVLENIFRGVMGDIAPVDINTTVADVAATTTVFDLTSAAGLQVGDPISVDIGGTTEMRPISAIATDEVTVGVPFSAAPADTAVAKVRIYRLANALNFYTIVNWLRDETDTDSSYSLKTLDSRIGELEINFNENPIQLTVRGMSASTLRSAIPSIPSLPTFTDVAQARNFGNVWIDTNQLVAYEMVLRINNNLSRSPVAIGTVSSDFILANQRLIDFDMTLDAETVNNVARLAESEGKTTVAVFGHTGDDEGLLFGFNIPRATLAQNDYDKGSETPRLSFNGSQAFTAAGNDELVIAVA